MISRMESKLESSRGKSRDIDRHWTDDSFQIPSKELFKKMVFLCLVNDPT